MIFVFLCANLDKYEFLASINVHYPRIGGIN